MDPKVSKYRVSMGVPSREVFDFIDKTTAQPRFFTKAMDDGEITRKYLETYTRWITSTKNNEVIGLDEFAAPCYANGSVQSFDMFYMQFHTRRFRCFRGEYVYHQLSWRNNFPDWKYLEDGPVAANDAVVMSFPFSDFGGRHPDMDGILDICDKLGVPVLVDCAYFGTCKGVTFDFRRKCIEMITFSLSKPFCIGKARIGIRFMRKNNDDPLFVLQSTDNMNRYGAAIGYHLMSNFSADHCHNKYHPAQQAICRDMNLKPTQCVIFALGGDEWKQISRSGRWNRLCLSEELEARTAAAAPARPKKKK